MWFMVCRWPQSQKGDLCKLERHGPWPAQKWFIRDHVWRGRSKPGYRIVGSVTIVWLSTEADDQSSLHCVCWHMSWLTVIIGHRDANHGCGCTKISAYNSSSDAALLYHYCRHLLHYQIQIGFTFLVLAHLVQVQKRSSEQSMVIAKVLR